MHKNPLAIKIHTATSKSLACVALFAALLASSCQTFDTINSIAGAFWGNINANNANVNDNTNNANDNYAYDTTDENHNHMSDKFETAKDQGVDCSEKHHAGCIDGFCDSFLDYKCSTRCKSDNQCVSGDYFCRDDGRCVPKAFVSVWSIPDDVDDPTIVFPGGRGTGCNYTIDWGDGSKESFKNCVKVHYHSYAAGGEYTVTVTGKIFNWSCLAPYDITDTDMGLHYLVAGTIQLFMPSEDLIDSVKWVESSSYCNKSLKEIRSFGPVTFSEGAFFNADQLNKISDVDIPNANHTNMTGMFYHALAFNQPLEKWNTSRGKTMNEMFEYADSFNQPLEKWDMSHVTSIMYMFRGATAFNQPLEKWNVS
ncbi:MAG: BspA family leucine-rich repeat surface protein, partial [Proteobacteria bacterium]|nr:BspA family leucine-rich repeat surface protein [Pseudomonadota bacterium]